ncbi:hypothetical protein VNI00_014443 [Paramarasmius palmivorus]|uniref:TPR-like protein n=1 Tax=Paramarasmius palmivorus TaxID=297713 RepID=A0AAW0BTL7_9AGAR
MSNEKMARAEKLKDEGNVLFGQKKFKDANQKYTEALSLDDKNPVLYANRAACRLSLKRYLDASHDAMKATELNPSYAKAWARLATAQDHLGQPQTSINFWRKALEALPKENLTDGEKKQKQQYEAGLVDAIKTEKAMQEGVPAKVHTIDQRDTPAWVAAFSMLPELSRQDNVGSSAWIIASAYQDLVEGNRKLGVERRGGLDIFQMEVMEHISNSILTDPRAFHIDDPDWCLKVMKQIRVHTNGVRAWTFDSFDTLFPKVVERLEKGGWDETRRALATTLRCWIVMGHLEMGIKQNPDSNLEFLDRVVKTIVWGQKKWAGVDYGNRGAIFRESFLRGVRNLRLEAFLNVYINDNDTSRKSELLEVIWKEAEAIHKSIKDDPTVPPFDCPAFKLAYWDYPCAHGHVMKGFYHREKAKLAKDELEQSKLYVQAGTEYMKGASKYPDDDEHHAWHLSVAVELLAKGHASPKLILDVIERLKLAVPKMQKIWAVSSMAMQGRDDMIKMTLGYEKEIRRATCDPALSW